MNLKEIRIELTNICNYSCAICPREKITRLPGIMQDEQFAKILNDATSFSEFKAVLFTGLGEPMLDPGFFKKIKQVKDAGAMILMNTNGSLLTKKNTDQLIKYGIDFIRISLHSLIKETYTDICKKDNLLSVKENIIYLGESIKGTNIIAEINMVVTDQNAGEIETIKSFGNFNGLHLSIWKAHNWVTGRSFRTAPDESRTSCGRPFNGPIQIQWNGDLVVCSPDYNSDLTMGNVFQQSIAEIINGEAYQQLRDKHIKCDFDALPCKNCDQLYCSSGQLLYTSRGMKIGHTAFFIDPIK